MTYFERYIMNFRSVLSSPDPKRIDVLLFRMSVIHYDVQKVLDTRGKNTLDPQAI